MMDFNDITFFYPRNGVKMPPRLLVPKVVRGVSRTIWPDRKTPVETLYIYHPAGGRILGLPIRRGR
jgi:hypothetical protein